MRGCALSGEHARRITHRYVEREATQVLIGQSVWFKVEGDSVRTKRTEAIVYRIGRIQKVTQIHLNQEGRVVTGEEKETYGRHIIYTEVRPWK